MGNQENKNSLRDILWKFLLWIIFGVVLIVGTKIIDDLTEVDTSELEKEKQEMLESIESWKDKYAEAERDRTKIKKEKEILLKEIKGYEAENDTVITTIRDANINRDFSRLDSLGDDLLDRLRRR